MDYEIVSITMPTDPDLPYKAKLKFRNDSGRQPFYALLMQRIANDNTVSAVITDDKFRAKGIEMILATSDNQPLHKWIIGSVVGFIL